MSMRTECSRMLGCFVCLLSFSMVVTATEPVEPSSTNFSAALDQSAQNASRLQSLLAAKKAAGDSVSSSLQDELALWRQIELVVAQRKTVFEATQSEPPPVETAGADEGEISRFLQLDEARDDLAVAEDNLQSMQRELQAERSLMLDTKELLHQAEQNRRLTTEHLLSASADSSRQLQTRQRLNGLRVRLHQEQLQLHRTTIGEISKRHDRIESIIATHRDRIERAMSGSRLRLSDGELAQQLAKIGDMEQTVRGQLSKLDRQLHELLVTSPQESNSATNNLDVIREESQLLRQLLAEIASLRECWKRRYIVSNRNSVADQWMNWLDETRQAKDRLAQIHIRLANRTMLRRQQASAIRGQSELGERAADDPLSELAPIERIIEEYGSLQMLAARARRTYTRFAEDLEARQGGGLIRYLTSWVGNRFRSLWEYELTAVDDRSITVGKLVTAFLLLIVGLIISKVMSSIVAFRILPRFGFSHAAAMTIRQMMMYCLFVAMTMLSLHMVNVPLTIFAFLGGAAAIGVGFGSQNTIANFISGLILLIQRPIRIGDLVNVDGIDANVEHIGARATRVRTSENLEVLIPNSNILHNRVTNWTLSDTRIRTCVTVGVAYGTDVRPVVETLQRVVAMNPKVLNEQSPIVLFEDFGDSSLVFTVHFWIHMRTIMDRDQVRSDVRVAIDHAFRHAGIVIAFPQRDVHVDLRAPIEVALTDNQRSVSRPRRAA